MDFTESALVVYNGRLASLKAGVTQTRTASPGWLRPGTCPHPRALPAPSPCESRQPVVAKGLQLRLKFSSVRPVSSYRENAFAGRSATMLPQASHEPMTRIRLQTFGRSCATSLRQVQEITCRERDYLVSEFCKVSGLMPLLMKRRNHGAWTTGEKAELVQHLKRLRTLSPYLVLTVVPGSFIALPALAWWLDRRRQNRRKSEVAAQIALKSGRPGDSTA